VRERACRLREAVSDEAEVYMEEMKNPLWKRSVEMKRICGGRRRK